MIEVVVDRVASRGRKVGAFRPICRRCNWRGGRYLHAETARTAGEFVHACPDNPCRECGCETGSELRPRCRTCADVDGGGAVTPILSVYQRRSNAALIAEAVAPLWIRAGDVVLDVTYGRGLWWKDLRPERFIRHDLRLDEVDFRQLPELDASVDVVAFDPPYVSVGGRGTTDPSVVAMADRFGMHLTPRRPEELAEMIAQGVKECARVLRPGGRLLAKCQDYIDSGRYFQGRHRLVDAAHAAGLEQVDEFVHVGNRGPQPSRNRDGTLRRQLHSRRSHSILCVFVKPRRPRGAS